jgi:hypothetical protein
MCRCGPFVASPHGSEGSLCTEYGYTIPAAQVCSRAAVRILLVESPPHRTFMDARGLWLTLSYRGSYLRRTPAVIDTAEEAQMRKADNLERSGGKE